MTINGTLCFVEQDGKFLMLKKADKLFGGGKWNAPGGKVKEGETLEQCAMRETLEETGLNIKNIEKRGVLNFFTGGKFEWSVHVFLSDDFEGQPKSGEEGQVRWIEKGKLPFDSMWEDDRHWLPLLLDGKKFEGWFYFTENFQKLTRWSLKEM